jgi:hypothetical protein
MNWLQSRKARRGDRGAASRASRGERAPERPGDQRERGQRRAGVWWIIVSPRLQRSSLRARFRPYVGAPHGLPITHADQLTRDILDFIAET